MQDTEARERSIRIQKSARCAERVIAAMCIGVLIWVIRGLPQ